MLRPAEDKAGAGTVPDRRGFPSPAADPGPREARPGGALRVAPTRSRRRL